VKKLFVDSSQRYQSDDSTHGSGGSKQGMKKLGNAELTKTKGERERGFFIWGGKGEKLGAFWQRKGKKNHEEIISVNVRMGLRGKGPRDWEL